MMIPLFCLPAQNFVIYYGEGEDLKVILDNDLFHPRASKSAPLVPKIDVLVTTYERLILDKHMFKVCTLDGQYVVC